MSEMNKITGISLLDGEVVKLVIRRAKIGVILIWAGVVGVGALVTLVGIFFGSAVNFAGLKTDVQLPGFMDLVWLIDIILVIVGLVATYVYCGNELTVTNRRVIHKQMLSPFAVSTNTIDLDGIEDVSLHRDGIWHYLFHVGTIRMATVGDETTYTFVFVDTPQDEVDLIAKLVSKAKETDRPTHRHKKSKHKTDKKDKPSEGSDAGETGEDGGDSVYDEPITIYDRRD
jgi:hypothetical protein